MNRQTSATPAKLLTTRRGRVSFAEGHISSATAIRGVRALERRERTGVRDLLISACRSETSRAESAEDDRSVADEVALFSEPGRTLLTQHKPFTSCIPLLVRKRHGTVSSTTSPRENTLHHN